MARRYPALVFFAALLIFGSSLAPGSRVTHAAVANRNSKTHAGKAHPDKLAAKLVKALTASRTPPARQRALDAVMRALHIGVYTAKGKRIVRGSERSRSDLYLYDFEVGSIGLALAARRTWSLDDLGAILYKAGFKGSDGKPLAAATLGPILSSGMKAGPTTLEPLLLRRLGLAHKPAQNLGTTIAPQKIRLDALQLFILVADVLGTRIHALRAPKLNSRLSANLPFSQLGLMEHPQQAGQCSSFGSTAGPPLTWTVNWLGGRSANRFFTNERDTGTIVDDIHGTVLGQVLLNTYVETPNGTETHEGDPQPGPDLVYHFHVSLDVIQTPSVTCGPLLGLSFPQAGPLPNVKVSIDTSELVKYGKVSYSPSDRHTGQNGVVQMTFTPKNEGVPGFGQVVTAHSLMSASLGLEAYDIAHPIFRGIGQDLFPLRWAVSRHAPRGFKFDGITWHTERCDSPSRPCDEDTTTDFSGQICGETPYGNWQLRRKFTVYFPSSSGSSPENFDYPAPNFPIAAGPNFFDSGSGGSAELTFVPTPGAPTMRASVSGSGEGEPGSWNLVGPSQIEVPVTEDMSCPAPTP